MILELKRVVCIRLANKLIRRNYHSLFLIIKNCSQLRLFCCFTLLSKIECRTTHRIWIYARKKTSSARYPARCVHSHIPCWPRHYPCNYGRDVNVTKYFFSLLRRTRNISLLSAPERWMRGHIICFLFFFHTWYIASHLIVSNHPTRDNTCHKAPRYNTNFISCISPIYYIYIIRH